ncbi:MAG: carbohydrate ABC transporter permease [Actinomycetaceae bacterium]|nr:carbohydrate ABC transporter permease [Actinomycetaceae bacterium]
MTTNVAPAHQKPRHVDVPKERPWRRKGESNIFKPTPWGLVIRYVILTIVLLIAVLPFLWELSTSLKGAAEDIYSFPPNLIPREPTLKHYATVTHTVPVVRYAWHSLLVAVGSVISNTLLATAGGYALGCMKFRGKWVVMAIFLSTMLLPGEVTLTSQFLTIKALGLANTLWGVFLPGAIGAMNVLLMAVVCRNIPQEVLDAAAIDGATTWQRIRHIVWPNVRGMASVVALFSFIGAWDDFLWPLVVLSDPAKYTLTVGMQYLHSNFGSNPRVVAAGTIIALVPIIILFASMQKYFFKGVEEGGVKG